MSRVYLDACFVIDLMDPASPRHDSAVRRFSSTPRVQFCGSGLLVTECLVRPIQTNDIERVARFDAAYARLEKLEFNPAVFVQAAQLRARHGIKTPDALHLACAIVHGYAEFWTHDERRARLNGSLALTIVT